MQVTFKGTTEQFVEWLEGNVRQDTWPKLSPDTKPMSVTEHDIWLRSIPWFVNTYPFKPPPSLDLPLKLEIRACTSRADSEEAGMLVSSDIDTIVLFEVCCPVPGGVLIEADCLDPTANDYFVRLLAKLREQGWLDLDLGSANKSLGGRPRCPEDDWAFQEIKKGHDQAEVYNEWLDRIPKDRRSKLADSLDTFKKAMRYREKRE